jgi:hypothetical protein
MRGDKLPPGVRAALIAHPGPASKAAADCGTSESTAQRVRADAGVAKKTKLTTEDLARIASMRADGKSLSEVTAAIGRTRRTIEPHYYDARSRPSPEPAAWVKRALLAYQVTGYGGKK